ncbi:hypothetical protein Tco_1412626, partial [Tanacetum coccineum]
MAELGVSATFLALFHMGLSSGSRMICLVSTSSSGLRKVTDDMKAMNRKNRAGIVSSGENKAHKSAPSAAKDGPPKLEL